MPELYALDARLVFGTLLHKHLHLAGVILLVIPHEDLLKTLLDAEQAVHATVIVISGKIILFLSRGFISDALRRIASRFLTGTFTGLLAA